jgi:hypothetical protein
LTWTLSGRALRLSGAPMLGNPTTMPRDSIFGKEFVPRPMLGMLGMLGDVRILSQWAALGLGSFTNDQSSIINFQSGGPVLK